MRDFGVGLPFWSPESQCFRICGRWVFLNFTLWGLGLSLWGFIQKPPVPPLSIGPDRLCTFPDTQRAEYLLIKEQNHLRVEGLGFSKPDTV